MKKKYLSSLEEGWGIWGTPRLNKTVRTGANILIILDYQYQILAGLKKTTERLLCFSPVIHDKVATFNNLFSAFPRGQKHKAQVLVFPKNRIAPKSPGSWASRDQTIATLIPSAFPSSSPSGRLDGHTPKHSYGNNEGLSPLLPLTCNDTSIARPEKTSRGYIAKYLIWLRNR
jgi:hypothetical protein